MNEEIRAACKSALSPEECTARYGRISKVVREALQPAGNKIDVCATLAKAVCGELPGDLPSDTATGFALGWWDAVSQQDIPPELRDNADWRRESLVVLALSYLTAELGRRSSG